MQQRGPQQNQRPQQQQQKQRAGSDIYRTIPFKKRKMPFTEWVYRNKIGVSAIVVVFIALFFVMVSVRFEISTIDIINGYIIEVPQEKIVEQESPEEIEERERAEKIERELYEDVKNRRSDESSTLDAGLKDDRGTNSNELYKEAEALQERLSQNRNSYQRGLADDAALSESASQRQSSSGENEQVEQDKKVKGKVTVSYDLGGRRATYLPVPAYKCENGGEVVVEVEVNNNGDVVEAKVKKTTARNDLCLNDTAVSFAKQSRFDIGANWPKKHKGTITYLFLNQ